MEIRRTKLNQIVTLNLKGRLDIHNYIKFQQQVNELVANQENQILVDFSGLENISTAGLRSLLSAVNHVNSRKGTLVLCSMEKKVKRSFDRVGFTRLFRIYAGKEEALTQAFRRA